VGSASATTTGATRSSSATATAVRATTSTAATVAARTTATTIAAGRGIGMRCGVRARRGVAARRRGAVRPRRRIATIPVVCRRIIGAVPVIGTRRPIAIVRTVRAASVVGSGRPVGCSARNCTGAGTCPGRTIRASVSRRSCRIRRTIGTAEAARRAAGVGHVTLRVPGARGAAWTVRVTRACRIVVRRGARTGAKVRRIGWPVAGELRHAVCVRALRSVGHRTGNRGTWRSMSSREPGGVHRASG
jgi:hypothetical protein